VGSSGIVSNSVALNPVITGNTSSGRVAWDPTGLYGTYTNNQARSDMTVNSATVSGTLTDKNGAGIALGMTLSTVFSGWNTSIWNIPNDTLDTYRQLPTLKGFYGTQNPTLLP